MGFVLPKIEFLLREKALAVAMFPWGVAFAVTTSESSRSGYGSLWTLLFIVGAMGAWAFSVFSRLWFSHDDEEGTDRRRNCLYILILITYCVIQGILAWIPGQLYNYMVNPI